MHTQGRRDIACMFIVQVYIDIKERKISFTTEIYAKAISVSLISYKPLRPQIKEKEIW